MGLVEDCGLDLVVAVPLLSFSPSLSGLRNKPNRFVASMGLADSFQAAFGVSTEGN